jgi:hypothetical protein
METEEKQLPDLEVVLICTRCEMEHTPYTLDDIMDHCAQCGKAVSDLREAGEFVGSVNALLTEAHKTTPLSKALKAATDKSAALKIATDKLKEADKTSFDISIRARKAN